MFSLDYFLRIQIMLGHDFRYMFVEKEKKTNMKETTASGFCFLPLRFFAD